MSEFKERRKGRNNGSIPEDVSIITNGNLVLTKDLRRELNNPSAVRLFHADNKIAFEPCDEDHTNAYRVGENGCVSLIGMLKHDLGYSEGNLPVGRYDAEYDEETGLRVIDLDES